ncbi:Lrp/AsnC family transcriptional regulator [Streptomyces sp. MST-110588]|uniref:Lrp/AsnC family transcriptional regulator n=1 Tax=Streptomyces sp. MST-110588 TaxID=2833628 RepID=UPI001F5C24B9|nr:Lrp/AsnC family transcriptional regulator [Streptomyces sp. MST-110588]
MKTDGFDALDRGLVHALQIDGRAPFSKIAEVLGVSDQTVARRYTRLRTAGVIKVLGLSDPRALGEVEWLVRIQSTPDTALAIAEALARRTDTAWVSLMSGGTEISALCRAASSRDSDALLLQKLPRTPSVVGVTAHCMLHEFFGGPQNMVVKSGALTEAQVERLRPSSSVRRTNGHASPAGRSAPAVTADATVPTDLAVSATPIDPAASAAPIGPPDLIAPPDPVQLGDADRRLLDALAQDGRTPLAELAAVTGWSLSTVRRRLAELRADGVLYFDVDYDLRLFGLGVTVALWLSVTPAELAATGEALAEHPEVAFACATTGPNNLFATVLCPDVRSLYTYLTTRISVLPAVRTMESAPLIRRVKGPGPMVARRPAAPGRLR